MKTLLAALSLLVAAPVADETLALAVEDGAALTKTFSSSLELELEELEITFTVDGEEHAVEAPDVSMSIAERESLTFADEYLRVEDGRATKLRRRFTELRETSGRSMTGQDGEEESEEQEGESALEGKTVVLSFDADDEAWSAAWAEGSDEGDADLLAELEDHADLLDFLPGRPVAVGDEWEVPVAAFVHLSSPCGEVHLRTPRELEEGRDEEHEAQFEDNLEGEITAKLVAVEDGVATIELACELETEVELAGESEEVAEGLTMETERALTYEFELEGRLLWNLAAGHAASLELAGPVRFQSRQTQSSEQGGSAIEVVQTQRLRGNLQLGAEFE